MPYRGLFRDCKTSIFARVRLKLYSRTRLQHTRMFGTEIAEKGPVKDVCAGDSGLYL